MCPAAPTGYPTSDLEMQSQPFLNWQGQLLDPTRRRKFHPQLWLGGGERLVGQELAFLAGLLEGLSCVDPGLSRVDPGPSQVDPGPS